MNRDIIDLRHNYPVLPRQDQIIQNIFESRPGISERALVLTAAEGNLESREIAADWLSMEGYPVKAEQVYIGSGGHHGCLVAILAFGLKGKTIAVEELTYATFRVLASIMDITLVPVKMDEDGLIPDSLRAQCKLKKVDGLYFMPSVHNPTGSVVPLKRRHEIVTLAHEFDFKLIEDDAYGFLEEHTLPNFGMLAPERTFYIQSFSKHFAPGLKVAYFMAPVSSTAQVIAAISATTSNSAPLLTELCSSMIQDGTMLQVIKDKRKEGARRQKIAISILEMLDFQTHPNSWHLWAKLPKGIKADEFVATALKEGVDINSSSNFLAPGVKPVHAVRIGLGGTQDENLMIKGLEILKRVISGMIQKTTSQK